MIGSISRKVLLVFMVVAGLFMVVGCDPKPTTFTLTILLEGQGSVNPPVGTQTYDDGTVVHLTATPSSDWEFEEWIGEVANNASASNTIVMNKNQTVKAVFKEKEEPVVEYTLTLRVDGQGVVNPSVGVHTYNEGTIVILIATPEYGWEFKEWVGKVANIGNPETTVLLNENKTVTAVFEKEDDPEPTTYTLTMQVEGEGKVFPIAGGVFTFIKGTVVDLEAVPAYWWAFSQWIGEVTDHSNAITTVIMDKNKTVKAVFHKLGHGPSNDFMGWEMGATWVYEYESKLTENGHYFEEQGTITQRIIEVREEGSFTVYKTKLYVEWKNDFERNNLGYDIPRKKLHAQEEEAEWGYLFKKKDHRYFLIGDWDYWTEYDEYYYDEPYLIINDPIETGDPFFSHLIWLHQTTVDKEQVSVPLGDFGGWYIEGKEKTKDEFYEATIEGKTWLVPYLGEVMIETFIESESMHSSFEGHAIAKLVDYFIE